MRSFFKSFIHVGIVVASVEAIFFVFGIASMYRGNPFRLYSESQLEQRIKDHLKIEASAPPTGWQDQPRSHVNTGLIPCGSAWGSSFTRGDGVNDSETWPQLLSQQMHCQIENFGSDAFALDQTLVAFQNRAPENSLVIIGIVWPMLQGDMISSDTFMLLDEWQAPYVQTTKPIFVSDKHGLTLVPRPVATVEAIKAHYDLDAAKASWTTFSPPYTLSVLRAISETRRTPVYSDIGALAPEALSGPIKMLGSQLTNKIAEIAAAHHDRLAILFIPPANTEYDAKTLFGPIVSHMPAGVCVIDPAVKSGTRRQWRRIESA
jgi:hypothetical protein